MKINQVNTAFITTVVVSVVVFVYLVFLGYDEIRTFKDVIKIIASILFPIPILFFVRFLLITDFVPLNTDENKLNNQKPATLLLILSMVLGLAGMQMIQWLTGQHIEDHLIVAHLINSTTISSYVLNYILYSNSKVNGILSGVLLSLAVHVFFLAG
ncbi:hypothetical protein [Sediminibacter sp. Hel_I_10]|uniref:hypothetical protein n=1 Tax=Sediminibacter sp. Hel_I_10 TaxID=1392490 RepID=UPI00047EEDEF|nr:hypothetical protein [Sediminibacter sp. Hel_I_10]